VFATRLYICKSSVNGLTQLARWHLVILYFVSSKPGAEPFHAVHSQCTQVAKCHMVFSTWAIDSLSCSPNVRNRSPHVQVFVLHLTWHLYAIILWCTENLQILTCLSTQNGKIRNTLHILNNALLMWESIAHTVSYEGYGISSISLILHTLNTVYNLIIYYVQRDKVYTIG